MGPSRIRDQIRVSCIGRWILCHWATREAPVLSAFTPPSWPHQCLIWLYRSHNGCVHCIHFHGLWAMEPINNPASPTLKCQIHIILGVKTPEVEASRQLPSDWNPSAPSCPRRCVPRVPTWPLAVLQLSWPGGSRTAWKYQRDLPFTFPLPVPLGLWCVVALRGWGLKL